MPVLSVLGQDTLPAVYRSTVWVCLFEWVVVTHTVKQFGWSIRLDECHINEIKPPLMWQAVGTACTNCLSQWPPSAYVGHFNSSGNSYMTHCLWVHESGQNFGIVMKSCFPTKIAAVNKIPLKVVQNGLLLICMYISNDHNLIWTWNKNSSSKKKSWYSLIGTSCISEARKPPQYW